MSEANMDRLSLKTSKLAAIGLGYVGPPLAAEVDKKRSVVGFGINTNHIKTLRASHDSTLDVENDELSSAEGLSFTKKLEDIAEHTVFIVTVPTTIDAHKRPDLTPLLRASETIGKVLKPGDLVIHESTAYPGATEEGCGPVPERISGLRFNEDFFAGYSPERINPEDKQHCLSTITKVTSGSTPDIADIADTPCGSIIVAGTDKASSIRVAEAAKVIENAQRDLNIALVNELAVIFNKMGIDTEAVLQAAGTKWNFQPFRPGLVGGHCISVDPYYLTYKAEATGYHHPQIILAGRRLNDGMGPYVAGQLVKCPLNKRSHVQGARVLVMGLAFKKNCSDLRNTRVVDVISELKDFGVDVDDSWVDSTEAQSEYGATPIEQPMDGTYDGVVVAVAHQEFVDMGASGMRQLCRGGHVHYDLKYVPPAGQSDLRL
ncbi:nucleotide sugar dehydrogenase [Yoonia sp. F2084L]|uniref:nucleotide sugar dehydrogenase n=1 Tax=Yoonia sp. F2084L TaxID=2926419 RepID=UPI001FF3368C|nr:nucleotide sugar dehydrogenase [Yoonia sp. F2084L]MCK0097486.1 nucleotide sugar dehydrogenase [Yoonia sp. F2084L]